MQILKTLYFKGFARDNTIDCIKPVLHLANFFARREAKSKSWQCDWSAKKFAAKKLDQFLLFYCSREQLNSPSGERALCISAYAIQ